MVSAALLLIGVFFKYLVIVFCQPGVPAMTVPQPGGALQVLMDRAKETGVRTQGPVA